MRKIAIYSRSTNVIENVRQTELLSEVARGLTDDIVIFSEVDSGFLRPVFDSLMTEVQTGKISALYVNSLDRFDLVGTTLSEFLSFFRILADNKVRLVAVADHLDSSQAADKFFSAMDLAVARGREVVRGERIKIALQKTKDEGHTLGRPRAANYEAILELRRTGLSIQAIAERLGISRGAVQHCLKQDNGLDSGPA